MTIGEQMETAKVIAAYIAVAVPVTVAIANITKVALEWLNQRHTILTARIQQSHEITNHYLNRALDPIVPLAIRHQLLRFLATPDVKGNRLQLWAESELGRVGAVVDEANRAVTEAERELMSAKTAAQVAEAERKVTEAVRRQRSLLEPPTKPPITAASILAGLVTDKVLNGLALPNTNLTGAQLYLREMRNSDLSGCVLHAVYFPGTDFREALFVGADAANANFSDCDLRGADFRGARLLNATLRGAHLEGANLKDAILEKADLRATYDANTIWPDGFSPAEHGAVLIGDSKTALPG